MGLRLLFKKLVGLWVAAIVLCAPIESRAWGAGGHMMIAQIAFDPLTPNAKAQVRRLLAIPITPSEVTRKSKDFINAAHWADDLRPFPEFDSFKELHFIDAPFSVDGTPLLPPPTPNIVTALQDNVRILTTSTDSNAQARALRLIIHFVGDIHQPLHCATRVSNDHPDGDRGGNLVPVQVLSKFGSLKKTNLHSYWDGGIGSFPETGPNFTPPKLNEIPAAARKATQGNPSTDPNLQLKDPFNFQLWADESLQLAQDVAYKGISSGDPFAKAGTKVSGAYSRNALRVANRRVSWAGYRLAALLNTIWP